MHTASLTFGVLFLTLASGAHSECTRASLNAAAQIYLVSLSSGEISSAFDNTKYVQNNKTMHLSSGILSEPLNVTHSKITADAVGCGAYIEVISTSPHPGHVIGTQIHTDSNGTPTLIDSIVTSEGDWLFNATKSLEIVTGEKWDAIPAGNRTSRAALKAAIDAYLDLWGNPDAPVPWGTPCRRMEGSAQTGSGKPDDSCNVGIPGGSQPPVTNRRYVVDEQMGSANVLCDFGAMRNGVPDSHEIRLGPNGKLRYVHTMTVMTAGESGNRE
ncbi:hypothetical protein BU26DRAFT_423500 [Trematosphaeria pertusa]|uniref:DUF8021 domain-containing protein n=1 Tax=Trematosphaeria pertusa TaxID=390896 RepID=A0A6A6IM12_9PLEO|nr:uncharacterized protein BU26DRAFT_423500 [Trematosphaeria pertusa]KAF2251481.1 hypothetical protein BU26DRAFT_423500 [Trematosphaeria pertusa]